MIFIFPWRTDALIEHRPWATGAIILINVVLALTVGFVGFEYFYFRDPEPFAANRWAVTGGDFDPVTWVTSAFFHMGWFHLTVNMWFVWIFGLIVEAAERRVAAVAPQPLSSLRARSTEPSGGKSRVPASASCRSGAVSGNGSSPDSRHASTCFSASRRRSASSPSSRAR